MKLLVEKIFKNPSSHIPRKVRQSFLKLFKSAKNAEWSDKEDNWEVIFYQDTREYIALFDKNGNLLEQRSSINLTSVPRSIFEHVKLIGEMMNCIEISDGIISSYEVIYRDKDLTRHLAVFDSEGNLKIKKTL